MQRIRVFFSAVIIATSTICSAIPPMAQQLHPLFSKRVVGGSAANDGEFPFAVFISSPAVTENTACAGAILTDQIVVTSAYCVYDSKTGNAVDPGSISIGYGKSNASQQPRATVEKIIINSTYNATSNIDDIALLQVNIGNKTSTDVNRIPVYVGDIHSGDSLTVMGWGLAQKIGSAINNTLNYANVTVGDEYSCSGVSLYQNSNGRAICTRNVLTPGVGPCLGDYGGPLITYEDGVAKLVGVMSALATADGKKIDYCGNNNTLAYYTHISYYMGFLQLTTGLSENIFTGNEPLVAQQNSTNSGESGSNSKLSKGIIAAISIGAAIFVILVCALVFAIRFYRKKKRELKHEQQIYELGLQQLADELGGSYEPKLSSATSAFNSSAVTPLDDTSIFGRLSIGPKYLRYSTHSDLSDQPFSESIPRPSDTGTELTLDTFGKIHRHADGSPRVMDYIRPERDGKISQHYRHLLFYGLENSENNNDDLISL